MGRRAMGMSAWGDSVGPRTRAVMRSWFQESAERAGAAGLGEECEEGGSWDSVMR